MFAALRSCAVPVAHSADRWRRSRTCAARSRRGSSSRLRAQRRCARTSERWRPSCASPTKKSLPPSCSEWTRVCRRGGGARFLSGVALSSTRHVPPCRPRAMSCFVVYAPCPALSSTRNVPLCRPRAMSPLCRPRAMSRFVVHAQWRSCASLCRRRAHVRPCASLCRPCASQRPPDLVDALRVSLASEAKDEVLHESLDAISSMSAQHTELLDAMKASASEVDALKAALKVSCRGHIRS